MRRVIWVLAAIGAAVLVIRRLGLSISFGTVVLGDTELSNLSARPLDLIVVGMILFPSGTSPDLASQAITRLRVLGLVQADRDVIRALSGRVTAAGAIHSVD